MIPMEKVIDFLQEYGQLYVKGNKINMRCMLCGDSKKSIRKRRMTITYNNGEVFFHCFNCEKSGTLAELYSELKGVNLYQAIKELDYVEFDNVKKVLSESTSASKLITNKKSDNLNYILDDCLSKDSTVDGYINKQYHKKLLDFIQMRRIPDEYNVYIAIKGEYRGRIIIPIFNNDNIVYFQGRSIKDDFLRYKNPVVEKSDIVMNIDKFNKDKFIIVTEGIIDAMMIECNQGTCVLGGSITDDFISMLLKHTDKGIIIATDNDEQGHKAKLKLIDGKYGKTLRYFTTPSSIKDLNEYKIKSSISNMYDLVVSKSIDSFNYQFTHKLTHQ